MKLPVAFTVFALLSPAMADPTFRCADALCLNFQQIVSADHEHLHRDTDSSCVNFQQFVPLNHRHLHRNSDVNSPTFQQFVPEKRPRKKQG